MTFIAMQKLLRLRALIQDSPPSSNDALVGPLKEEPFPGERSAYVAYTRRLLTIQGLVQLSSPVIELTP